MYWVIGVPPFDVGAAHVITTVVLPPVAVTLVGTVGRDSGTKLFDAAESSPRPDEFVAVEMNVYVVPPVSPVNVHTRPDAVHVEPPGDAVGCTRVSSGASGPNAGTRQAAPPAGPPSTSLVVECANYISGACTCTIAASLMRRRSRS